MKYTKATKLSYYQLGKFIADNLNHLVSIKYKDDNSYLIFEKNPVKGLYIIKYSKDNKKEKGILKTSK